MENKDSWLTVPDRNYHEYVIGIDFGHGETSAAFCPIGWDKASADLGLTKDLEFDSNSKVMPSALSIADDDIAYVGEAAFLPEILKKVDVNVSFKKKPEDLEGKKEKLMIRYMHEVYSVIREKNSALFTDSNHLVYIAVPSGWDNNARDLYGQMAAMAGLPIAGVTSESRAAFVHAQQDMDSGLQQYMDKGAIVFDMGSSTLDFTYLCCDTIIDYGYDCGASQVEMRIYENICKENEEIVAFEKKYPNMISKLMFEARCAKESVYFHPDMKFRKTVNFEDIIDDEDFEDTKIKFIFEPGALNRILEEEDYIENVRNAMLDFRNNRISGKPINVVFMTGGASRMNFLKPLIQECWNLTEKNIYSDQDPSLTISRGIAEVARGDIRSGGSREISGKTDKIISEVDVYSVFRKKFSEALNKDIKCSIATPVIQFKACDRNISIPILEKCIEENIGHDINTIATLADRCILEAFDEVAAGFKAQIDKSISNYSKEEILLERLEEQSIAFVGKDIQESLTDKPGVWSFAITAIATDIILKTRFGKRGNSTKQIAELFSKEKKTKAKESARKEAESLTLNAEERGKIYTEYENRWDEICTYIHDTIEGTLEKATLREPINSKSNAILKSYAEKCLNQARFMLD